MKILLVNPNISQSVSSLIHEEAKLACHADTLLSIGTANCGVAYIETPGEAITGAAQALELIAEHAGQIDGAIIAAFGDPGVQAAKEVFDFPVVGLTEAAVAQAFLLGGRFSIVGISERIGAWYETTVGQLGLASRLSSYRGLAAGFSDVGAVQEERRAMLLEMCHAAIRDDGADSIILGGAPLAGLARQIADDVPVPLIDGVGSAVRMLEATIRGAYKPRRAGALSRPPEKAHRGQSQAMANFLGRKTG